MQIACLHTKIPLLKKWDFSVLAVVPPRGIECYTFSNPIGYIFAGSNLAQSGFDSSDKINDQAQDLVIYLCASTRNRTSNNGLEVRSYIHLTIEASEAGLRPQE